MVLFMIKNFQNWVQIGMGVFFGLKPKKLSQSAAKHTTLALTE